MFHYFTSLPFSSAVILSILSVERLTTASAKSEALVVELEWEDVELNMASVWEEYAYIEIAVG